MLFDKIQGEKNDQDNQNQILISLMRCCFYLNRGWKECSGEEVACRDKQSRRSPALQNIFQLFVLILKAVTSLFGFTLPGLISLVSDCSEALFSTKTLR